MLRPVEVEDLPLFFEQQRDPDYNRMAAFTSPDPNDRTAFMEKWRNRILPDESVIKRTIVEEGQVIGNLLSWSNDGKREVCYGIDRAFWGKGLVSRALEEFLLLHPERPLYAHAARDNLGSIRVLEKCGFRTIGLDKGFANARGREIEEVVMELAH